MKEARKMIAKLIEIFEIIYQEDAFAGVIKTRSWEKQKTKKPVTRSSRITDHEDIS